MIPSACLFAGGDNISGALYPDRIFVGLPAPYGTGMMGHLAVINISLTVAHRAAASGGILFDVSLPG
jgi:hypothetical protein